MNNLNIVCPKCAGRLKFDSEGKIICFSCFDFGVADAAALAQNDYDQHEEYEESVRAWYRARGMANVY